MLEERAADTIANDETANRHPDSYDRIPKPQSVTYTDYENPFSLVGQSSGAPHIAKLSSNAWVGCGNDVYALECLGKGHIRIEPVDAEGVQHPTPVHCYFSIISTQEMKGISKRISHPQCCTKKRRQRSKCHHSCEVGKY